MSDAHGLVFAQPLAALRMILAERIADKSATIGVVGLGYVGLPVAACFAAAGFSVIGLDRDEARVGEIAAGTSSWTAGEPELAELLHQVVASGRLRASARWADLAAAEVVLIAVDTPVDADRVPRHQALAEACRSLAGVLGPDALVVVESTVAPGTTLNLVAPLVRAHHASLRVGHCPERLMPGKLLANLRHLPRVCGGDSAETAELMRALYRHVVDAPIELADCTTAELVKTAENAYRDVNIAFANELALICQAAGASFPRVRELVNQSPGRDVLWAGAGVGGHCIPKDSWLLAHAAPTLQPMLLAAARARNDSMPTAVLACVQQALAARGVHLADAQLAVLGLAYLPDCADTRGSPSAAFVAAAEAAGARCRVHDPLAEGALRDLAEATQGADAVVLLVAHADYQRIDWAALARSVRTPLLVDARYATSPAAVRAAGLEWVGLSEG